MKMVDFVERAFIEGYRRGLEAYAHWSNGQQLVGTTGTPLSRALCNAKEEAKPYFEMFMEKGRNEINGETPRGS